jgi:hypothetical protein
MNTNLTRTILAAALFAIAPIASAQDAERPVAVKTDGLPDHLRARIEEKAQQGPTALIRYVNSTRHIHNLRVEMIVKPDDGAPIAKITKESPKMADRDAGKK